MTRYLAYTSPARGHLYPIVPTLLELAERGHEVHVRTLASEVAALRDVGLHAEAIDPAIEGLPLTDWQGSSPLEGLVGVLQTFEARARHEVGDFQAAIDRVEPDVLLVDTTTIGANTIAELGDRPWAQWLPFFYGPMPFSPPPCMEVLAESRRFLGAPPLDHDGFWARAPLVLYLTAPPFAPSTHGVPSNFRVIGPGNWDPPVAPPTWLEELDDPVVLVTASSEYQLDAHIIDATLDALGGEDVRVVATTAAHEPEQFEAPANAVVERLIPHHPVIARAACVVCHGGMGITQKALSAGVPVCVVPGGRDQSEVAERVVEIGAGTTVAPVDLDPKRLRDAVFEAFELRAGAGAVANALAQAGGPRRAADDLESLHLGAS